MLVIVGILLIFGLVVRHKWRNGAAKKEEILRLVAVASEEEANIAKLQAIEEYHNSPPPPPPPPHLQPQLEKQYYCAVCHCPTTTRCSRCKAVRYCSGKCQIIHWRQGHKDDCQPAISLYTSKEGEFTFETASENQFAMHLNDEAKLCSDPSQELDDSGSSSSSASCFFSSTERSETSFDSSTGEAVELETPISPDKASSVDINSQMSRTSSEFDDADVPSPSRHVYSVDKRKGQELPLLEEFVQGAVELRTSQPSTSARSSSAADGKNRVHMSTSKATKSVSFRPSDNHQMPNVELSSVCSKSLKMASSHEYWENESKFRNSKETRYMTTNKSSGNCQKLPVKTVSSHAISSEIEDASNLSQSTSKGLKTSVRKFVQNFRAPKPSKSCTFDMVKDSGGNYNQKVIFPLKLFMQLYSCDDVELHPFGLVNCGNSCYANAVLQCLTFTRPITSYLLQGLHSKTCRKRDWCFICKFEHLIQKGQETRSPLSPVGLLSLIQPIGREEDAHEFLRNVVDKMQSICLEEAGVSGILAEDCTLMGLTFGGYLRSKVKCMKCLGRSERCEQIMDLSVEIDGNIYTLEEALVQFTTSETLGGDDKYKCSRCKSYEKAKKKLTVLEAPNILPIVLKRFRSGNLEKLNKLVQFPEVLNLSPYMSGTSDKYPVYHLYAVVVHLGVMGAAYSGHYVSYVKDFRGDWFRIDDSRVSHVNLQTVLSSEAYILFYARHTPRGSSSVRNNSTYSDGKTKRSMEAISSSNNTKKKNPKSKPSSFNRNTEPTLPHQRPDWMSPNDFTGNLVTDPERWLHRNPTVDSSSDSSSIFSVSDAGSYSTDSTKDSSADDISGYIFGPSWYHP
ncbi:hypothetical protein ACP275_08G236100 [Erythranthe tilingii]